MKSILKKSILIFSLLTSAAYGAPQFLDFPASGYNPYSSQLITTVLDHEVPHDLNQPLLPFRQFSTVGPFGFNGAILSFSGELFVTNSQYPMVNLACYPKTTNSLQPSSIWGNTLKNTYGGTTGCTSQNALNYDNHPGYDYGLVAGTPVYPAASGNIIFSKCIKTFADVSTCESYGALAIDHGNGFVTQYLHMKNVYYGAAASGRNQWINGGYVTSIGQVSNTGLGCTPDRCNHLHFEVLQRKAISVNSVNYYDRANYIVVDPYGYKSTSPFADKLLSKPGCLWKVSCQY